MEYQQEKPHNNNCWKKHGHHQIYREHLAINAPGNQRGKAESDCKDQCVKGNCANNHIAHSRKHIGLQMGQFIDREIASGPCHGEPNHYPPSPARWFVVRFIIELGHLLNLTPHSDFTYFPPAFTSQFRAKSPERRCPLRAFVVHFFRIQLDRPASGPATRG